MRGPFAPFRCLVAMAVLLATVPGAHAGELPRFDELEWSRVHRGGPVEDGMLLPGRLIVHFDADRAAKAGPGAAPGGASASEQLALDGLHQRYGARGFGRLFPGQAPPQRRAPAALEAQRASAFVLEFDGDRHALEEVARAYLALPQVVAVEPDAIARMHATIPNDANLSQQWWLRNTAVQGGDIRAIVAWDQYTGSDQVIVAIADSGVDWQHPDLGGTGPDFVDGNIWINQAEYNGTPGVDDDGNGFVDDIRGWDFVTNVNGQQSPPQDTQTPDNDPMDYDGHGTQGAGCASAIGNNGVGVAGVNWNAKVMALRIGWTTTSGQGVVGMSFAAQAMDYARINGADVYNASWGSSSLGGMGTATNLAVASGMVTVTAAGNANNSDASYLAGRSDVLAVAATNSTDAKASFSSFGSWVELSAPGAGITTTTYSADGGGTSSYASVSGTSFASPIVAGAAAYVIGLNPGATRQQVFDLLLAATDDIDAKNPTHAGLLGAGRLNLAKLFPQDDKWTVPDELPTMLEATNYAQPGEVIALRGGDVINERYSMYKAGVQVLGGWDAGFSSRDPVGNPTVLQPATGTGPVVSALPGTPPDAVMDGFEIAGGQASFFGFAPVDGYYGGGVLVRSASPTFRNLLVRDNEAGTPTQVGAGGGIAVMGGTPVFEDCTITGNRALGGSGIYVFGGNPLFTRCVVDANTNHPKNSGLSPTGGAILAIDDGGGTSLGLADCQLTGHAVEGPGGGIHATGVDLAVEGGEISGNDAQGKGGGIFASGGSVQLTSGLVLAQNATTSAGGNHAGGGLYADGSAVHVDGIVVHGNTAGLSGGGLQLDNCSGASVANSILYANTGGFFGGALGLGNCTGATISGNTVADNLGNQAGGNGIYITGGGSHQLENNIVAHNGDGSGTMPDGVYLASSSASFSCNLVWQNATGNYGGVADPTGTGGNVEADPMFCPGHAGSYTLQAGSPAAASASACGQVGAAGEGCNATSVPGPPALPATMVLEQNHPNPFNPATTIGFALPVGGPVELGVFDLRGRSVATIFAGELPAGAHELRWDGRDASGRSVASGSYFYALDAPGGRQVRKMELLK